MICWNMKAKKRRREVAHEAHEKTEKRNEKSLRDTRIVGAQLYRIRIVGAI